MPFEYISRREKKYYVRIAAGKNGKPRYTLTGSRTGQLADAMPEGFEIFELPETGHAVLRKKQPTEILESERDTLQHAVERQVGRGLARVEIDPKALVVYVTEIDAFRDLKPAHLLAKYITFSKMMRFELATATPREFTVDRWCFRGSIDNWLPLDGPAPLNTLIAKYVKHLGQESFFELV